MRDQIQIMTQILELCTVPRSKTNIGRKANLSSAQLKTYLRRLVSRGLLEHDSGKYMTTSKGHSFLEAITQLDYSLEDYTRRVSVEMARELERKRRNISHERDKEKKKV